MAKYDSVGELVWAKRATALAGGSIAVDGTGNSYVTGGFARTATFAPGEANQTTLTGAREDGFVAKYDSADQTGPISSNRRRIFERIRNRQE